MEKFIQLGKEFGLEGAELLAFVEKRREEEREEKRREEEKEERRRTRNIALSSSFFLTILTFPGAERMYQLTLKSRDEHQSLRK